MSPHSQNRQKPPTIRDVADKAGVSKSLASRAFVNPEKVGAQSLEKILAAAAELDYRPNWTARTLNSPSGGFTGILIADLYSPAILPIVIGAYRTLKRAGREVLMSLASLSQPGDKSSLEEGTLSFLGDLRPEELLIVGSVHDMSSLEPLASRVPTVVAGARNVSIPTTAEIFTDDNAGLEESIKHLTDLGHSKIAHIAGTGIVGNERAHAYEQAMARHGLQKHVYIEHAGFEEDAGFQAALKMLSSKTPPTAITTASDHSAVGALGAINKESHTNISVIGYGDVPAASFHLIDLTTVKANNQAIGSYAAEALLEADIEKKPNDPVQIRIRPSLVLRSTTRSNGDGAPLA